MFIIINFSLALNQHIIVIVDGSRDTEEWRNGCWKYSFAIMRKCSIKYIKKKIENCYFELQDYYI